MTMFKNTSVVLLLFVLLTGCSKNNEPKQIIISSDEDGVICSAKCNFNDTIYYENRFPDTIIYYHTALTKKQNQALKQSVRNLTSEKSIPDFKLLPGSATFIIESDDVAFYEGNYSIPSHDAKKILTLLREKGPDMKICKKVEDFWNIEGVTPPENPNTKVE